MTTWSRAILDKYIAPGLSSLTSVTIPDLTPRFPGALHWLGNYFLNSVLRAEFKDGVRQIVLGYIRRTANAFSAYHEARSLTLEVCADITAGGQPAAKYYASVNAWEGFFLQANMALTLCQHLFGRQFVKNDGSPAQRVYDIANQIKHPARYLKPTEDESSEALPLYLSNSGATSFDLSVGYVEASEVLAEIGEGSRDSARPYEVREPTADDGTVVPASVE